MIIKWSEWLSQCFSQFSHEHLEEKTWKNYRHSLQTWVKSTQRLIKATRLSPRRKDRDRVMAYQQGRCNKRIPSGNRTWLAGKSPMSGSVDRKLSYKWYIFHCHVWLAEGTKGQDQLDLCWKCCHRSNDTDIFWIMWLQHQLCCGEVETSL